MSDVYVIVVESSEEAFLRLSDLFPATLEEIARDLDEDEAIQMATDIKADFS